MQKNEQFYTRVQEASEVFLGCSFLTVYTTRCQWQAKVLSLLVTNNWHSIISVSSFKGLVHSNGSYPTTISILKHKVPAEQTPTDSDDHQDVTMMDDESGQSGGVTNELDSQITLDDSSDDELVQDVLDEMKETISKLAAFK